MVKLNPELVEKQGLSDEDVKDILDLHEMRIACEGDLEYAASNPEDGFLGAEDIPELLWTWTNIQEHLQKVWKFEVNKDYHKFWTIPGCTCPKLDNEDAYPTGYYVKNLACPIHKYEESKE